MMKDFVFIAFLLFITNAKTQQIAPCTSQDTQLCGIPTDCSKFVMCIEGRPYVVQCHSGNLYSAQKGQCIQATQCPQQTTSTCITVQPGTTAPTTTVTTPSTTRPTTTPTTAPTTTSTTTPTVPTAPIPTPVLPCTSSTTEQVCGIPTDCSKFVLCRQGRPYIVQCLSGNYYSTASKKCIQATQCPQAVIRSTCTSAETATTTTAITPSTTTPTTTKPTTTTSTTTKAPVTTTTTTTTTTTPRPTPPAPVIVPPCTSAKPETYEIANDCTRYLSCNDGSPSVCYCPTGQFFNVTSGKCVVAAQCPQGAITTTTTPKPTTTTTTTPWPTTTTTTAKPTTTTAKPVTCNANGSSTHPYPGDQGKYYYCYNGSLYVVHCPAGMIYNANQNGCIAK